MLRTQLCDLLGVEHPIMLAGMGGVSYSEVAAAVSEAGGFGCLGAAGMDYDEMVREIRALKARTTKPFGVDLLTASPRDMVPFVETICAEGARAFVAGLGVPAKVVDLCHRNGVVVVNMCGKVSHALRAVDAGCDIVVAQGTEAGGHTGQIATLPLVPLIVDAVKVPVVAAGGIFDGRGLVAALALGAQGIWMGTRFIASTEARAHHLYKERILDIDETGTVVTRAYSGKTMRAIRTQYTDEWERKPEELQPFPLQAMRATQDGVWHCLAGPEAGLDPERDCMPTGQSAGGIREVKPCREIIADILAQAESILGRLPTVAQAR
ncbi:MAG: nitronate monooxygenase [Deltaproteobacteria bacterium]|nr:MAG: nitronate monooxygenase [Deltaproteobacteria bacterium]